MTTAWGGQPPNINAVTQTHWGSSAIGLLGSVIKAAGATGEHGAGIAINDSLVDASEYLFWIVSQPASGTVAMTELAQATLTVSADGAYSWVYAFRENGIDRGTATVTDNIGAVAITLAAANCSQPNSCTTGAVTITVPSLALAAANCSQSNASSAGVVSILPPGVLPTVISAARTYSVAKDTPTNLIGMGNAPPLVWKMDLDANLDFACEWAAWLADAGDTLASVYVRADPLQLVVTVFGVVQTTKAAAMIRPQQIGTWPLIFRITTMQGRIDERTIMLEILNR